MNKYIYDENNGLWYELQGDYYLRQTQGITEQIKNALEWGRRMKSYMHKPPGGME